MLTLHRSPLARGALGAATRGRADAPAETQRVDRAAEPALGGGVAGRQIDEALRLVDQPLDRARPAQVMHVERRHQIRLQGTQQLRVRQCDRRHVGRPPEAARPLPISRFAEVDRVPADALGDEEQVGAEALQTMRIVARLRELRRRRRSIIAEPRPGLAVLAGEVLTHRVALLQGGARLDAWTPTTRLEQAQHRRRAAGSRAPCSVNASRRSRYAPRPPRSPAWNAHHRRPSTSSRLSPNHAGNGDPLSGAAAGAWVRADCRCAARCCA